MTKFIIYFTIANLLFLASNIPFFISIQKTPQGTFFPLYQPSQFPDYNGYLAAITLGKNGYNYFRNPYTSEKPIPSMFYSVYIAAGKIAGIFSISAPFAYHLLRIFSVELYLFGLYFLSIVIVGKKHAIWPSLISLILTISPPFFFSHKDAFVSLIPWWVKYDALARLDGIPHHILGQGLFLFSLALLLTTFNNNPTRPPLRVITSISTLLAFLAAIIFPPAVFPYIFALPVSLFIYFFIKRIKIFNKVRHAEPVSASHHQSMGIPKQVRNDNMRLLINFSIVLIATIFALAISWAQTQAGYHKSVWVDWEIARWNKSEPMFNQDLFFIFLPSLILTLPSLLSFVNISWSHIFLLVWAILPLLLLPFVDIMAISKIRLLFLNTSVPFGMLCFYGLTSIHHKIKKRWTVVLFGIILLVSTLPITGFILFKNSQLSKKSPAFTNIYYPSYVVNAIQFASLHIPKDSIILSDEYMGGILPAFTPVISYFGHINLTVEFRTKQDFTWHFYTNKMTDAEALAFIKKNNISYVYWGVNEKGLGEERLKYSFLVPFYQDGEIYFYRIK